MTIAVLTAIYDGYDTLKEPARHPDDKTEFICVTDGSVEVPSDSAWRVVIQQANPPMHPNRAAKTPKMRPWDYTNATTTIWLDASFRIVAPDGPQQLAEFVTPQAPIAQFIHPWRNCIYDELEESLKLSKYADEPMWEQVSRYQEFVTPHIGLWATGVIVRRRTDAVEQFGYAWHSEVLTWSFQDQLSEVPMLESFSLWPTPLPGDYFSCPWISYEGSGRH